MSALQKAIRRGREDLALRAAATLLLDEPTRFWRRCGVIAFEDVGLASVDTLGIVTAALGGKRMRAALGGGGQSPASSSQSWCGLINVARLTISSPTSTAIPPSYLTL
jgi:hypothetical protein